MSRALFKCGHGVLRSDGGWRVDSSGKFRYERREMKRFAAQPGHKVGASRTEVSPNLSQMIAIRKMHYDKCMNCQVLA